MQATTRLGARAMVRGTTAPHLNLAAAPYTHSNSLSHRSSITAASSSSCLTLSGTIHLRQASSTSQQPPSSSSSSSTNPPPSKPSGEIRPKPGTGFPRFDQLPWLHHTEIAGYIHALPMFRHTCIGDRVSRSSSSKPCSDILESDANEKSILQFLAFFEFTLRLSTYVRVTINGAAPTESELFVGSREAFLLMVDLFNTFHLESSRMQLHTMMRPAVFSALESSWKMLDAVGLRLKWNVTVLSQAFRDGHFHDTDLMEGGGGGGIAVPIAPDVPAGATGTRPGDRDASSASSPPTAKITGGDKNASGGSGNGSNSGTTHKVSSPGQDPVRYVDMDMQYHVHEIFEIYTTRPDQVVKKIDDTAPETAAGTGTGTGTPVDGQQKSQQMTPEDLSAWMVKRMAQDIGVPEEQIKRGVSEDTLKLGLEAAKARKVAAAEISRTVASVAAAIRPSYVSAESQPPPATTHDPLRPSTVDPTEVLNEMQQSLVEAITIPIDPARVAQPLEPPVTRNSKPATDSSTSPNPSTPLPIPSPSKLPAASTTPSNPTPTPATDQAPKPTPAPATPAAATPASAAAGASTPAPPKSTPSADFGPPLELVIRVEDITERGLRFWSPLPRRVQLPTQMMWSAPGTPWPLSLFTDTLAQGAPIRKDTPEASWIIKDIID